MQFTCFYSTLIIFIGVISMVTTMTVFMSYMSQNGVMSVVARLHKHDLVKRPTTDEPCIKWIY